MAAFLAGTISFPRIAAVAAMPSRAGGDGIDADLAGIVALDGEVRAGALRGARAGRGRLMEVPGNDPRLHRCPRRARPRPRARALRRGQTSRDHPEFGVGFPPRIGSVVWHGTRYPQLIPLGGFVKMLGEDGEVEAEKMRQRTSEAAVDRAMEGAFNRKPIWVRIVVLVAGVAMNSARRRPLCGCPEPPRQRGRGPPHRDRDPAQQPGRHRRAASGRRHPRRRRTCVRRSRDLTAYVRSPSRAPGRAHREAGRRRGRDRGHAPQADRGRGGEGPRGGWVQLRAGSTRRGPASRVQPGGGCVGGVHRGR